MARFYDIILKDSPDGLSFVDHISKYSDGHARDNGAIHHSRNNPIEWPIVETGEIVEGEEAGESYAVTALAQEAVWDDGAIRAATQGEIDMLVAFNVAQIAATQAEALSKAKAYIGDLVMAIQGNLMTLGYTLPCDSAKVLSELTAKSLARELSDDQQTAKTDLGLLYSTLRNKKVTDEDIADLFAYIQGGGE